MRAHADDAVGDERCRTLAAQSDVGEHDNGLDNCEWGSDSSDEGKVTVDRNKPVHVIGVAGQGMIPLTRLLVQAGYQVTGCDRRDLDPASPQGKELASLGVAIETCHSPAHVEGVGVAIASNAIADDHVEVRAATRRGIEVIKRADALSSVLRGLATQSIAVAGTYGKSTTTALVTHLLQALDLSPTYYLGASRFGSEEPSSGIGAGPLSVHEACEFNNDFLRMPRDVAVILNMELGEHPETHITEAQLERAFVQFSSPARTLVIPHADQARWRRLSHSKRLTTFGTEMEADMRLADWSEWDSRLMSRTVTVAHQGSTLDLKVPVPAFHNLLNLAAALGAISAAGVDIHTLSADALADFTVLSRRLNVVAEVGGLVIADDYAHSPTQIAAARRTASGEWSASRLACVFQPSCYRRVVAQLDRLVDELQNWHHVWILGPIGECPGDVPDHLGGLTAESLAKRIGRRATYVTEVERVAEGASGFDALFVFGGPRMNGAAHLLAEMLRGSTTR